MKLFETIGTNLFERLVKKRKITQLQDLTDEERTKLFNQFVTTKIWKSTTNRNNILYSSEELAKILFENEKFDLQKWKECENKGELTLMLNNILENYEAELKRQRFLAKQWKDGVESVEVDLFSAMAEQEYEDQKLLEEEQKEEIQDED